MISTLSEKIPSQPVDRNAQLRTGLGLDFASWRKRQERHKRSFIAGQEPLNRDGGDGGDSAVARGREWI